MGHEQLGTALAVLVLFLLCSIEAFFRLQSNRTD